MHVRCACRCRTTAHLPCPAALQSRGPQSRQSCSRRGKGFDVVKQPGAARRMEGTQAARRNSCCTPLTAPARPPAAPQRLLRPGVIRVVAAGVGHASDGPVSFRLRRQRGRPQDFTRLHASEVGGALWLRSVQCTWTCCVATRRSRLGGRAPRRPPPVPQQQRHPGERHRHGRHKCDHHADYPAAAAAAAACRCALSGACAAGRSAAAEATLQELCC